MRFPRESIGIHPIWNCHDAVGGGSISYSLFAKVVADCVDAVETSMEPRVDWEQRPQVATHLFFCIAALKSQDRRRVCQQSIGISSYPRTH